MARRAVLLLVALLASLLPVAPAAGSLPTLTDHYVPVGPLRLADTRTGVGFARLAEGHLRVPVPAPDVVPTGTRSVVVTVTVNRTSGPLVATVNAAGRSEVHGTVNATEAGQTIANTMVVRLGAGGVDVRLSAPAEVVVDVSGAFVESGPVAAGRFVPLTPRRVLDTRSEPSTPSREILVPLPAGVPADATALAVNVTAAGPNRPGYLTLHPAGETAPFASHLNTDRPAQTRAAAAIVPVSPEGLGLVVAMGGHVVVDVTGWFTGPSAPVSTDGLFVGHSVARVLDTRSTTPPTPIWPGGTLELDLGVASAFVVNLTATRPLGNGYVTAYPAGTVRPHVSSVNVSPRSRTVANLAVVPASTRGLALYSPSGTHVVVDVVGWFLGAPVPATLPPAPNEPPPAPPEPPARPRRVSLVGDSLVAGLPGAYVDALAARGVEVTLDAQSSRALRYGWQCRIDGRLRIVASWVNSSCRREGLEQVAHWAASGQLQEHVIVALGNNDAPMYTESRIRSNLAEVRRLVGERPVWLVSLRARGTLDVVMQRYNDVARSWCAADGACRMIEWANHPSALAATSYLGDGEHLTTSATRVRAEVVGAAFDGAVLKAP